MVLRKLLFKSFTFCVRPAEALTTSFPGQGQRTVYRLTLVKEWNTEELDAYASLVSKGNPDFIEVKVCFMNKLISCLNG